MEKKWFEFRVQFPVEVDGQELTKKAHQLLWEHIMGIPEARAGLPKPIQDPGA